MRDSHDFGTKIKNPDHILASKDPGQWVNTFDPALTCCVHILYTNVKIWYRRVGNVEGGKLWQIHK